MGNSAYGLGHHRGLIKGLKIGAGAVGGLAGATGIAEYVRVKKEKKKFNKIVSDLEAELKAEKAKNWRHEDPDSAFVTGSDSA